MKHIKLYNTFEGRGISDIIKYYSTYIYNNYMDGNTEYEIDLDDYQELPLSNFKISIKKKQVN